jgi:hypothetical protein
LTGKDFLEPNASTNAERIEAMKKLHKAGFKTFASIEPIISFKRSITMIRETIGFCDMYKIGLLSGKTTMSKQDTMLFVRNSIFFAEQSDAKIYFKDSILEAAGINREDLPDNCVSRDFSLFNNKEL